MKLFITQKLRDQYPDCRFVAIKASSFPNEKSNSKLNEERIKLQKQIRSGSDKQAQQKIDHHKAFHDSFNSSYPIEFQYNSIKEGKDIPVVSTLVDALFMAEMSDLCIISGHDTDTIDGDLIFDISLGGETYTKINGKDQTLKVNDIVLKSGGNIDTSLLYGPGLATKITKTTTNCLYLFWFSSAIEQSEIDQIINNFNRYLSLIGGENSQIEGLSLEIATDQQAVVTPWSVKGNINYDKLILDFGVSKIDNALLERIEKKAGKTHHMLRRNVFFAHRDLKFVLDEYDKGNKFFLYTGRAPSGNVTLGHMVPWIFTKWLQDVFGVELWFQFPDEEKFLFNEKMTMEDSAKYLHENMLDVIAVGFDPEKTHFIIDTLHAGAMYKEAVKIAKRITFSTVKSAFGFTNDYNLGSIFYTAMQAVPAILPSVVAGKNIPCLIPHAIDQDPHFRISRDVMPKVGHLKPGSIQCRFLPGLGGMQEDGKMSSSSGENQTIYMTDDPKTLKKKINKYAFSGGRDTVELHRKLGGNPDIDVAYQWLTFFEEDDDKLKQIYDDYKSGAMLSGELKAILIEKLTVFMTEHQERRKNAENLIDQFIWKEK